MLLENIGVIEKANLLEQALKKAESDLDYSIQVAWGNDVEEMKAYMTQAIKQTRELFATGRIDSLDYDVRNSSYANYNTLLDNCLRKFPEYAVEKDIFKERLY